MKCNVERLVKALIGAEMAKGRKTTFKHHTKIDSKPPVVVTVSRGYGSCGTQVARKLAEHLNSCACDRDILEQVAKQADVDIELVEKLANNVKQFGMEPWRSFITGKSLSAERYHRILESVVLNIAHKGGVIVGRGANLVLGPDKAFRVRIIGSLDNCAERISKLKKIDLDLARKRVQEINKHRNEFLKKLYLVDISDSIMYDLVINSDRFTVEQMVDLVLLGIKQTGFEPVNPEQTNGHSE